MSKSICTTIQRELDEMALNEDCSVVSLEHLTQCDECRDYYQKQTKLREMVGSLGTVSAPPDFEIRLRSRLARDNASRAPFINLWSLRQQNAVVATMLVLLIGGAILVTQLIKRDSEPPRVAESAQATTPASVAVPKESPIQVAVREEHNASNVEATPAGTLINKRTFASTPRNKRNTVAADFSSLQAPVIQGSQTVTSSDPVFPVDASQQSLKVSLLDGRGNRKTISVPTVTFGSQRVVPTPTSFAPKGVW